MLFLRKESEKHARCPSVLQRIGFRAIYLLSDFIARHRTDLLFIPQSFTTRRGKNSCVSVFSCSVVLNHWEMTDISAYSCKHETRPDTHATSRVHNRHPPCEHSLWRLFTTTPIGCEHSMRPLCTRRVAVVHMWWRRRVFQVGNR